MCDAISTTSRPNRVPESSSEHHWYDEVVEVSPRSHSRFAIPFGRKRSTKEKTGKEIGPTNLSTLHKSTSPLIDIIFVHGLRGGSVKTWQKGGDARRFWPKLWLPTEPGFEHANIHAFGYDADWDSDKGDIFKIQDFGRQLIEEMRTSPDLIDNPTRPIIMLGHSMGGLVIKKAFVIAQDSAEWRDRIRSIFFLATPHRGSKYASLLNGIFTISRIAPARQYIGDLAKGSTSLKAIHDDFINVAGKIIIYSFYETLKMKLGPSSAYIVERDSAVLGLPNEHVKYANATHCDISKYKSRLDPTYVAIRNSLALVAKDAIWKAETMRSRSVASQCNAIKNYLGVKDSPIEWRDILPGSCQWIQGREDFRQWQSSGSPGRTRENNIEGPSFPAIFWVYASPGSGKTFLSSHVQAYLENKGSQIAYYYFRLGSNDSRSLAPFLRSAAYQMATSRDDVRERLHEMYQNGTAFDIDDPWTVWMKIFKKCILQLPSETAFFWVVDALDECEKYSELFNMLKGEKASFPLRIFITSRPVGEMQRLQRLNVPRTSATCIKVPPEDTLSDIRSYILQRLVKGSFDCEAAAQDLANVILRKSSGCFLWVRIVLDELDKTHTAEEKMKILQELPEGMKQIYQRSVGLIEANNREKHVSKALLSWIVAGTRQLKLDELAEALQHDVFATIEKTEQDISELCGQLAVVNADSNVVELIHPTAREFLLSDAGSLTISEPEAHARIALVCLKLLSGTELQPPRTQRALLVARPCLSPLLWYAIESFSEHVLASLLRNDAEVLTALEEFCRVNILGWIERVAASGNCHGILRVSRNLTRYLEQRASVLPEDPKAVIVLRWLVDLGRLVTKFGEPLLKLPSSIYFLIPPMCPANTAIAQVPRRRAGGLVLRGIINADWDDCTAHVDLGDEGASTVSLGEEVIILGTDFGTVSIINQRTYQRETMFDHGNAVDLVHLADAATVICTTKAIILQDGQGGIMWQNRLRLRCLCVEVCGSKVVAVMSHGHLMKWHKSTGELVQDEQLHYRGHKAGKLSKFVQRRAPSLARLSPEFEMTALAYNDGCVCFWDAEDSEFIGLIEDEQGRAVKELLFNPNKNIPLLMVVYSDYGLAIFDTWTTEIVQSHCAPAEAAFLSAACSPDGHTFATADGHGNITIWSFEQLRIIENIQTPASVYRILRFTGDGLGILDISDSSMKCWTPAAIAQRMLPHHYQHDATGRSELVPQSNRRDKEGQINVVATHPQLALAVTGNPRGDVLGISFRNSGHQKQELYRHSASVQQVAISNTGMIASYDSNARILVGKYEEETGSVTHLNGAEGIKIEAQVRQLCFSADGDFILVSMDERAAVYRCHDASCVGKWHSNDNDTRSRFWMAAQATGASQQQFWLFEDHMLKRYSAKSFPRTAEPSEILLEYSLAPGCTEREIARATLSLDGPQVLTLQIGFWAGMAESSTVVAFCLSNDDWKHPGSSNTRRISNIFPSGSRHWRYLLGWDQDTAGRMILMDRDSWICSASVSELRKRECQRHFYVPRHLLAPNVSPALMATGDVVLPNGSELISVSGGFKFGYPATFD